jgi:hypothetical protein
MLTWVQHRVLDIHGLNGEHSYLVNGSLPSSPRKFSYSPIQLLEDGIDQDELAKVATKLLDEVVEVTFGKNRDVSYVFNSTLQLSLSNKLATE